MRAPCRPQRPQAHRLRPARTHRTSFNKLYRKTAVDSIHGCTVPYALLCVEFYADQSLAQLEDQVDGGLREPGRAAVLPPLRHKATNARWSQGRTWDAAATRLCSDAVTSATLRVFSPQSGLTHSRCAGTAFSAARSDSAISAVDGTRGEWMS